MLRTGEEFLTNRGVRVERDVMMVSSRCVARTDVLGERSLPRRRGEHHNLLV